MTQKITLPEEIGSKIKAEAYRLGFSLAGITTPAPPTEYPRYEGWLKDGFQSGMTYLTSDYHRQSRMDPRKLMPTVRSIICLGYSYPLQPLEKTQNYDAALLAGYSFSNDYHLNLPVKMKSLAKYIESICGTQFAYKTFTDSAPILERELASHAGLGWIGKNSCLISPLVGSGFLLAELFTDLELTPDQPFTRDLCGSCRRCLQACPTRCIQENRTIDSNGCISYHTIESRHQIPLEIAEKMGNWFFGCEICQMVCPWNKKELANTPESEIDMKQLIAILEMDSATLLSAYANSALLRANHFGLLRNALIVLIKMDKSMSIPAIEKFLNTCVDPVLISTANWALNQISIKSPP